MLRFNGSSWVNEDSPYDVGMFIPGTHGDGALMAQVVLTRAVSFADDFAGARAYAGVTATAETVLDVHRNGSPIGTITFGIGASAGTFATAGGGAETFAAGDRLAIINEDPADATLADLSITFLGQEDLTMAWGSDTAATQLSSITTEQFFDQVPTLNPRETAHLQVSVDFPGFPDRPRDRRGLHHARRCLGGLGPDPDDGVPDREHHRPEPHQLPGDGRLQVPGRECADPGPPTRSPAPT